MEQTAKLLKDYSDTEKGAYLGAIASLATADHSATEDEVEYLKALCESADIVDSQQDAVLRAAQELTGEELTRCLDIIKGSDLKYSLMTDLLTFAQSDKTYSPEEKANVEKIAQHLNISQNQFSLLDQFVKKSADSGKTAEEVTSPGFAASLGLEDKFSKAGINFSSLTKGLLGIAGPMLLAGLFTRGLRGGGRGLNPFGNQGYPGTRTSGLGSLISTLNGGRGFGGTGGLLSRILGSRF